MELGNRRAASELWRRMHELGRESGLEPLSWELPHLQMGGLSVGDLKAGRYPGSGDESWAENLEAAIAGWTGAPAAPPSPAPLPLRPALEEEELDEAEASLLVSSLPSVGQEKWHRKFGGVEWRVDKDGIYLRDHEGGNKPLRSPGAPITCRAIWNAFSVPIETMARRFGVAPELIIMTIAVEAAAIQDAGVHGACDFPMGGACLEPRCSSSVAGRL